MNPLSRSLATAPAVPTPANDAPCNRANAATQLMILGVGYPSTREMPSKLPVKATTKNRGMTTIGTRIDGIRISRIRLRCASTATDGTMPTWPRRPAPTAVTRPPIGRGRPGTTGSTRRRRRPA